MTIREPAVAGIFYAGSPRQCREHLQQLVPEKVDMADLPETIRGGIAPHAGWAYSGRVCGLVYAAIAARTTPRTVVLFGASHRRLGSNAAVFPKGTWETPLGQVAVDADLAEKVTAGAGDIAVDPDVHQGEHSIEVQVPFVQYLWPEAKILPILVEPSRGAPGIGEAVARAAGAEVVYVGSTDLTHYGPSYGFAPEGGGQRGLAWAKDVNDRRIVELMRSMKAELIVDEVIENRNACGPGAVAATIAACRAAGATRGVLLAHVNSDEVARSAGAPGGADAVGYAGIVFGQ